MKFAIFFIVLGCYFLWEILYLQSNMQFIVLWLMINMYVMGLAYLLNKPYFILGKKITGDINYGLMLINLPWLFFTWFIFKLQILLSKENR